MAKTYVVTAPLVIAKNELGADLYVYKGGVVPDGQSKDWLEQHLQGEMIAEADAAPAAADTSAEPKTSGRGKPDGEQS
jgi:hypothetical protein